MLRLDKDFWIDTSNLDAPCPFPYGFQKLVESSHQSVFHHVSLFEEVLKAKIRTSSAPPPALAHAIFSFLEILE